MIMRATRLALPLVAALGLSACAGMNYTEQRTATGALGGAAVGGLIGSFSGDTALGALVGAGIGGAGGYLYDQSQRDHRGGYRGGRRYDHRRHR
ncbi:MAG TPA: glycine zipper domain-containing protein [Roseomonas sp.]|jgi:hypothetical protein